MQGPGRPRGGQVASHGVSGSIPHRMSRTDPARAKEKGGRHVSWFSHAAYAKVGWVPRCEGGLGRTRTHSPRRTRREQPRWPFSTTSGHPSACLGPNSAGSSCWGAPNELKMRRILGQISMLSVTIGEVIPMPPHLIGCDDGCGFAGF